MYDFTSTPVCLLRIDSFRKYMYIKTHETNTSLFCLFRFQVTKNQHVLVLCWIQPEVDKLIL